MSNAEVVQQFREALKTDPAIRAAMRDADTEDRALAIARDFGFEFTAEDVYNALGSEAVSDDELAGVSAAGSDIDYTGDPMQYWGTPKYRLYFQGSPDEPGYNSRHRHGG